VALGRTYPHWLADRLDVPVEDVIWAAEQHARDYPFADLEPIPWECWCGSTDRDHTHGPPPWREELAPLVVLVVLLAAGVLAVAYLIALLVP
jgi:hypothetical protein